MKKILLFLLVTNTYLSVFAQTTNASLNTQLKTMKTLFLTENYEKYIFYIYPKVYEIMGGQEKMISATKSSIIKMKNDGYKFLSIDFSNPSKFEKKGNETQFTITQNILMDTPKGKVLGSYSLIGISNDKGKNWKFIDTSGKKLETMLKYFPNLSDKLIIKPKIQKIVE
ncbi:hypothetical protein [Chryseobacterium sp. RR2-3-20]|uniref:hypothetical protein n=1 Tax=Chryseobacterium sp. RR2-3-20 TaxID=2787626 RepID=UPI001ADFDDEF|nr:hypothetical protein [Chryseobacterium sp. RR2-3-20]